MGGKGSELPVDRCVCENKPFTQLKAVAVDRQLDLEGLMSEEGCGTHCGMCRPYLERMLATGDTVFDVLE